jgi:hypothetical protein
LDWLQVRRKNDTFSPQAWRGDDGARQVKTLSASNSALDRVLITALHALSVKNDVWVTAVPEKFGP